MKNNPKLVHKETDMVTDPTHLLLPGVNPQRLGYPLPQPRPLGLPPLVAQVSHTSQGVGSGGTQHLDLSGVAQPGGLDSQKHIGMNRPSQSNEI